MGISPSPHHLLSFMTLESNPLIFFPYLHYFISYFKSLRYHLLLPSQQYMFSQALICLFLPHQSLFLVKVLPLQQLSFLISPLPFIPNPLLKYFILLIPNHVLFNVICRSIFQVMEALVRVPTQVGCGILHKNALTDYSRKDFIMLPVPF